TLHPLADQRAETGASLLRGDLFVAGIEINAATAQAMSQQDLGIQAGKLRALLGEMARGPIEQGADSPDLLLLGNVHWPSHNQPRNTRNTGKKRVDKKPSSAVSWLVSLGPRIIDPSAVFYRSP